MINATASTAQVSAMLVPAVLVSVTTKNNAVEKMMPIVRAWVADGI
jgi:hypothetical protein